MSKYRNMPVLSSKHQQGTALLIAIVLVFMLTVLGISAMRGATLENQLASNVAHKELTFQAAESATDVVLSQQAVLLNAICNADPIAIALPELTTAGQQTTNATLIYGGFTVPSGTSFGVATSYRFMIRGESRLADGVTSTAISQGIELTGAAGTFEC